LTTDLGVERSPSFSPDGGRLAYTSARTGNFELYVQVIGAGERVPLTTTPETEMSPTWSPDGRFIAFVRERGKAGGIYKIPAMGGAEQKLADAFDSGLRRGVMP
jgi:TolB protein